MAEAGSHPFCSKLGAQGRAQDFVRITKITDPTASLYSINHAIILFLYLNQLNIWVFFSQMMNEDWWKFPFVSPKV